MATRRRSRRSKSLAVQSAELGMAVPEVIAHRMAGMDSKEFQRMGSEKIAAFNEAWTAMAFEAVRVHQQLTLSFMQSLWFPSARRKSASQQLSDATLGILGKGMAPIHRRAVANAKRLRRTRR